MYALTKGLNLLGRFVASGADYSWLYSHWSDFLMEFKTVFREFARIFILREAPNFVYIESIYIYRPGARSIYL